MPETEAAQSRSNMISSVSKNAKSSLSNPPLTMSISDLTCLKVIEERIGVVKCLRMDSSSNSATIEKLNVWNELTVLGWRHFFVPCHMQYDSAYFAVWSVACQLYGDDNCSRINIKEMQECRLGRDYFWLMDDLETYLLTFGHKFVEEATAVMLET